MWVKSMASASARKLLGRTVFFSRGLNRTNIWSFPTGRKQKLCLDAEQAGEHQAPPSLEHITDIRCPHVNTIVESESETLERGLFFLGARALESFKARELGTS